MTSRSITCALLLTLATVGVAGAETKVTVKPAKVRPGDPVLVTVTGTDSVPKGTAGGRALQFFAARTGYQAVFAVPLNAKPTPISVEIASAVRPETVEVTEFAFPETALAVEDDLANPDKAERARIDTDNAAILAAMAKSKGDPLFTRGFRRPPGEVTSIFGEWRRFYDGQPDADPTSSAAAVPATTAPAAGQGSAATRATPAGATPAAAPTGGFRSQHLGLDLFAREGSKVRTVAAGTVVLVREAFLSGNLVVVAHGAGISTAYYHLSKISVAEGDKLDQGAEVGLAGHTGRATGPHLHVSIRIPGGFVDPAAFFKLGLVPAPAKPAATTAAKPVTSR